MAGSNNYILLKDALKHLKIKERALQTRCKNAGFKKGLEGYEIPIDIFNEWSAKRTANRKETTAKQPQKKIIAPQKENSNQLDLQIQSLQFDKELIEQQYEALKIENEALRNELAEFDISPDERMEVFTHDEYNLLQTRLQEWFSLQKEIEHKDQLFNVEKKSLGELLEHYKNQFEYQKKQSDKILEMHQTLIDTIQKQSAIAIQRNIIEAKEKDVVDKNTWRPKE